MRKVLGIVLAAIMLLAMVGCTTAPDAPPANTGAGTGGEAEGEEKVIRIACESWHVTKVFLEHAAEAFEADHPGVKVELQTYADQTVISNYAINWAAGNTPVDMVIIDGAEFCQQFVAKDLIYDWESELNIYDYISEDAFSRLPSNPAGLTERCTVCPSCRRSTSSTSTQNCSKKLDWWTRTARS